MSTLKLDYINALSDANERYKIDLQLNSFNDAKGLFGTEAAKTTRDKKKSS